MLHGLKIAAAVPDIAWASNAYRKGQGPSLSLFLRTFSLLGSNFLPFLKKRKFFLKPQRKCSLYSCGLTWWLAIKKDRNVRARGHDLLPRDWCTVTLLKLRFCEKVGRGLGMAAGLANLWHLWHFPLEYLGKGIFVLYQWLRYSPTQQMFLT